MEGADVAEHLTLEVAGDWTSGDFVSLFSALDRLYVVLFRFRADGLPLRTDPAGGAAALGRITRRAVPALQVERVSYASPGTVSLLGLGEVMHELRELLKDLWGRNRQEKERGRLELEAERSALSHEQRMRDLEYLLGQAAVVRQMREAGRLAGLPGDEVEAYLRRAFLESLDGLGALVVGGKVTGIRTEKV